MMRIGKFADFYRDVTKEGTKIPQEKYLRYGRYPVIDQGRQAIAGRWDNDDGIFKEVPAIVFGDHTRAIKYIEEPFFIGADGVKILRPVHSQDNPKYLYYALQAARIPDLGYSRHFKAVKELEICIYSTEKQNEIVRILEKIDHLIEQRHEEVSFLDQLVKSRFVELFGDPVANTFGWKQALLREVTSKIGSGATPRGGKESYQAEGITLIRSMNVHDGRFEYKDLAHITDEQAAQLDNVTVEDGDVFINITGASVARSCIVPKDTLPARVNQHVAIIRCVRDRLHPVFANNMFLNDRFKGQLLDIGESGGATRQAITKQQLEILPVILPPLELQEQFATFVEQTDKSKLCGEMGVAA